MNSDSLQLLVSVRNPTEARAAVQGGARIVDVKEPARGSLGAADAKTVKAIVDCVTDRPVSVAAGELLEWQPGTFAPDASNWCGVTGPIAFVKVGLAGAVNQPWKARFEAFWTEIDQLWPQTDPVAVAYADHITARAPSPARVLDWGIERQCPVFLIDTWRKDGRGLLDWIARDELRRLIDQAHATDVRVALAGSVTIREIPHLVGLGADVCAVRGAACRGGREGEIDEAAVRELARVIRAATEPALPVGAEN